MRTLLTAMIILFAGCDGPAHHAEPDHTRSTSFADLAPVTDALGEATDEPLRAHPYAVALVPGRPLALVTLRGSEIAPGRAVAVIDLAAGRVVSRLAVGARPVAIGVTPDGGHAIVLSELSPWAAVIALYPEPRVEGRIGVGYYAQDLAFTPDGLRMLVTNRATDRLEAFELVRRDGHLEARSDRAADAGVNPGPLAISSDGTKAYVADAGGLGVRVFDARTLEERSFISLNAPMADVAAMGPWMVVTTLNDTNGLPCEDDADYPGRQGDGIFAFVTDRTCGRGFADIQNEIAVIDSQNDLVAVRYTSDTAEASEADREGDHDPALMRVVGALPHTIAVTSDSSAWVTMGASFEVVEMTLEPTAPPVPPELRMPRALPTGLAPRGVAADTELGVVVVANVLGESVSIIRPDGGERIDVPLGGDAPPFPATDAEIGELFFFTSRFSTDGDQSCSHCHPDADADGKSWGVDVVRAFGRRAVMVMKNLAGSRPLLIEGVFEETDFNLEMEGISFRPDYHDSSYALQVQRRDAHYREVSRALMGREIGFDEMVRRVADFLVAEPRLLPSPFPDTTPEAQRGEALFFRPDVGCANCHPPPTFASPDLFDRVTTLGQFDLPRRDLDPDISVKFIEQAEDGFFNANGLRGLWDRRGALFHDGRARTIRETILTPGHRCLREGERAFNESNGVVDTNGGVSHLDCEQIDDLVAFLRTID